MAANEVIPYYEPGDRITAQASEAISGKRAVVISATIQSGPGLSSTSEGGNAVVALPSAGDRIFGIASHDVASGKKVTIIRGPGFIVPVVAASPIAAFDEVQVDADGKVVSLTYLAKAFLLTGVIANDNALKWEAVTGGLAGNTITITLVDPPGNNEPLAVAVAGDNITVTLETDGASVIVSTAAEVLAAVNADDDANNLVVVTHQAGSDGTGVMTALGATDLAGGAADVAGVAVGFACAAAAADADAMIALY